MAKNKKRVFKLNPEWMLKDPLDIEYNKYTLLDYLQKCERNFNNLQLYPDFVELKAWATKKLSSEVNFYYVTC